MEVMMKELGEIITGNTPSKKTEAFWSSEDICFVKPDIIANDGINEIVDSNEYISEDARKKARVVGKNSIFITCIGSIGKIGIASDGEYAFNQQINAIIPNDRAQPKYLAYNLLFNKPRLVAIANAPVVPIINKSQFGEFTVNIETDIDRQCEIVDVLDKLTQIIQQRNKEISALDELIKARFIELFGIPGTDAFGWGLVPLGSACNINPKKNHDPRLDSGLEVSFVPMPAVTERGEIDATALKEYDEVKTGFTYFAENDVLFAKITPCMENGKGAVAKGLHNGIGFGSTEFHVLRPISGKTDPYWIYTLTTFSQFRMDAASNMTGSAGQRRVPASFLENYRVSLPPIALQEQFAAFVEQTDKSKVAVQKALDETQILFDSLMQKYFG